MRDDRGYHAATLTDPSRRTILPGVTPDTSADPLVGTTLSGRYELAHPLRDESLGRVFDAIDVLNGGLCAVKVLDPARVEDEDVQFRFSAEIEVLRALDHPHVVAVTDAGVHRDLFQYAVQSRVAGQTLAEAIRHGAPFTLIRTARIAAQVARALATAHHQGVVHRTVSPTTIVLDDAAVEGDYAVLTDFGSCRVDVDDDIELVPPGEFLGKLAYLAPEYLQEAQVGPALDVYALGVVMWEMLVGRPPFVGADGIVIDQHARATPPTPSAALGTPDTWLDLLVGRMLVKSPSRRPSMQDVVIALQAGAKSPLDPPARLSPEEALARGPRVIEPPPPPPSPAFQVGTMVLLVLIFVIGGLTVIELVRLFGA